MKKLVVAVFLLVLVGCGAGFQTSKFNADSWTISKSVNGIIYYDVQMVKIRYEFTALANSDEEIIGSAAKGQCVRSIQKEELAILPNFNEPRVLVYNPPFLSSGQFGVTLENGILTSVNAQTASTIADAIKAAAKSGAKAATKGVMSGGFLAKRDKAIPTCNAEPVITSIERLEIPRNK